MAEPTQTPSEFLQQSSDERNEIITAHSNEAEEPQAGDPSEGALSQEETDAITRRPNFAEPLANANAIRHLQEKPVKGLLDVEVMPMPVTQRLRAADDEDYHYHWVRNDEIRIDHLQNALNYEFAPRDKGADAASYKDARKAGGMVLMRTPVQDFYKRKDRLNSVVNPAREAAPRNAFRNAGEQTGVETEDSTKQHRGPFSSVAGEK